MKTRIVTGWLKIENGLLLLVGGEQDRPLPAGASFEICLAGHWIAGRFDLAHDEHGDTSFCGLHTGMLARLTIK